MSEETTKRTLSDIEAEYNGLCAKAGHAQYQLSIIKADLEGFNRQLKDLNIEAFSLKEAEAQTAEKA